MMEEQGNIDLFAAFFERKESSRKSRCTGCRTFVFFEAAKRLRNRNVLSQR
jgi:hypothetical protein